MTNLVDEVVKTISNDTDGRKYGLNDIDGAAIDVIANVTLEEVRKRIQKMIDIDEESIERFRYKPDLKLPAQISKNTLTIVMEMLKQ